MNRLSIAALLVVASACAANSAYAYDGLGKGLVAGINANAQSFTCTCDIGTETFLTNANTAYLLPGGKDGGSFGNIVIGQKVTVKFTGTGSSQIATTVDLSANAPKAKTTK